MGKFTDRLSHPARWSAEKQDERDRQRFPAKHPCHDCAFRPGSPERADPTTWRRLVAQADAGAPFHCHFKHDGTEMPTDPNGNYTPACDEHGAPVGYPICRGWVAFMGGRRARESGRAKAPPAPILDGSD